MVTAESTVVDRRTAELGTVIGEEMVEELPLNGRGFLHLAGIQAGASAPGVAQWAYGPRQTSAAISARGKSRHGIRPSLHPGGLRCDSGTYSEYAPESRLVRRAQERSRCSRDFYHGLISGTRFSSTSYVFDGIPFKEHFYGAPGALVQVDAISEFKVQKGFFTGRGQPPGVVSVVTSSGNRY